MTRLPLPPVSSDDESANEVIDGPLKPKLRRRKRRGRVIQTDSSNDSKSDDSDFKKVPKKRKRKTKVKKTVSRNVFSSSSKSDSDSDGKSTQQPPPRRLTRSAAAPSSQPSAADVSENTDSGFKTSTSTKSRSAEKINPSSDASVGETVTFRYKTHKTEAVYSHTTKRGKKMYKVVGQRNPSPRSAEALIAALEIRYRYRPPQFARSPTPPHLSPESVTDEDVELEGKSYKLVKVGMSKQRSRGKFRRMYVYKDRINMKHMSRSAIINDIKNWQGIIERTRNRLRITNPNPDDIVNIIVNGSSYELRYDHIESDRSGMDLYRYKNGKECKTMPAWRKQLYIWQIRNNEVKQRVHEWLTHQTRPIPPEVMRRITPFRINPPRIHLNSMDAAADVERDKEMNEYLKITDKVKDGARRFRRRYLYFVVIIPEELVRHIQPDETGHCPEIYDWLRDHEDDDSMSIPLYVGRNSRRPEPSAFTFNPDVRTSIRREVNEGGRPFLIHVEEVNYPTRRAAREGIATLEAVVIAYFSWISPHTPRNSQVGKLKYCIANKHAEVDTFMDCNPRIKSHILAMASTRSRRPFHFLLDPSVPCPIDHSYPGQPYSAMMHPNRDKITEVILDKMEEEESTDGEESDYSEMDDMFTDDDDVFEDSSYPDSSAPQTPTSFLSSVRFERQSRGHNSCGMNAVNNFNQDGPVYTRDFFQDIAANLEEAERDVVDTGELDKGAYGGDIGDYSVEVLERALVFAHYQVSRQSDEFDIDSSLGFIYNPGNHWIAVRRVEDQWVEMDSMAAAPTIVTPLDVLKLVRQYGNAVIIVTGKNGQTDP